MRAIVLITVLVAVSCMEYVPSSRDIREQLPEFAPSEANVHPLYGYSDIDAMSFRVDVEGDVGRALTETEARAESLGWKIDKKTAKLTRLTTRKGDLAVTLEEARLLPRAHAIYVGWVEGHERSGAVTLTGTTEGRWADNTLWPKLEQFASTGQAPQGRPGRVGSARDTP